MFIDYFFIKIYREIINFMKDLKDFEKRIGISSACFYPMLTEDAFDVICDKLKYKVCELFLNTQSETEVNFLKSIKSKADDNEIKITAVHPYYSGYEPFMFFTEYKRRLTDSIKLYGMFFEAAQFLQSDFVIFHGLGPRKLTVSIDEYTETFLLIAEEAKKYGVELLHENAHTPSTSPIPPYTAPDRRYRIFLPLCCRLLHTPAYPSI